MANNNNSHPFPAQIPERTSGVTLRSDGNSLTMNEIVAQCFLFFIAGFETSSTTMTFALFELANHQDLQERVREELSTILAKHNNQMTYDSLSELKYMKQVIDGISVLWVRT
ncbi:hypothetical protein NQ318_005484 [Aromia moschata]|uniref:Cytochrome P450 n=1 Tax=Aromia moschata TaxID=1265417 RepID=A0AAV8XQH8_9CUCU|nr:hypothetical protein NQ318_005484 [Aromia moschata]